MRVFITGATGFIGTQLVRRLAQTDYQLSCLVKTTSNLEQLRDSGANIITGDLRDKSSLLKGLKGCDFVVNLADFHDSWTPQKNIYAETNIKGTQNLMESALQMGVSKVVHLSTALLYQTTGNHPQTSNNGFKPVKLSRYTATKQAGDLIAWRLYQEKGLPLVMVYSGNVIGPDDPNPTGQHIRNIIFRRVRVRAMDNVVTTYVYIQDLIESLIRALEKKDNIGERYLVGKYQYSLSDYNQIISKVSGVPLANFRIPDSLAVAGAKLFTMLADISQRPPLFGISLDALRVAKAGLVFDGSQAEKQLGISYTDIETALTEAIASYKK